MNSYNIILGVIFLPEKETIQIVRTKFERKKNPEFDAHKLKK